MSNSQRKFYTGIAAIIGIISIGVNIALLQDGPNVEVTTFAPAAEVAPEESTTTTEQATTTTTEEIVIPELTIVEPPMPAPTTTPPAPTTTAPAEEMIEAPVATTEQTTSTTISEAPVTPPTSGCASFSNSPDCMPVPENEPDIEELISTQTTLL